MVKQLYTIIVYALLYRCLINQASDCLSWARTEMKRTFSQEKLAIKMVKPVWFRRFVVKTFFFLVPCTWTLGGTVCLVQISTSDHMFIHFSHPTHEPGTSHCSKHMPARKEEVQEIPGVRRFGCGCGAHGERIDYISWLRREAR